MSRQGMQPNVLEETLHSLLFCEQKHYLFVIVHAVCMAKTLYWVRCLFAIEQQHSPSGLLHDLRIPAPVRFMRMRTPVRFP